MQIKSKDNLSEKGKGLRRGDRHPKATLTDHEVELVRKLRDDGMSFAKIAAKFEIGKTTVIDICAYRTR
jgi:DNA invertase Pin-like site-specific DNA recombinase